MDFKVSTTQFGKAGESLVAAQIMLASEGRLSPFLPLADDDGIDLLVYDKTSRRTVTLQVKSRAVSNLAATRTLQYDVRKATFRVELDAFLLAAAIDLQAASVVRAWLVPTEKMASVAIERPDKLSIVPSVTMSSKDRYTPFRCATMTDVVARLLSHFDSPSPAPHSKLMAPAPV